MAACSSVDCPVQNVVETVYQVCLPDGSKATLLDTLTISTTRSNGTDTVLLNRSVGTSEFKLPISYDNPEDTLFFEVKSATEKWAPAVTDTVFIAKTNMPQFESAECHIAFFHNITEVRTTHNIIDSITINKRSVTYDASTAHFHVYFKAGN